MAIAEGIFVVVITTILGGLVPAQWSVGTDLSTWTAPSVQAPHEHFRSLTPAPVRPRPARPGLEISSGTIR